MRIGVVDHNSNVGWAGRHTLCMIGADHWDLTKSHVRLLEQCAWTCRLTYRVSNVHCASTLTLYMVGSCKAATARLAGGGAGQNTG